MPQSTNATKFRLWGAALAVAILTGLTAGTAWAPIGSTPDRTIVTNGTVYTVVRSADTIYIGGDFTRAGPRTGGGAAITTVSGRADEDMPEIIGGAAAVRAVVSDGVGGWFIAGSFGQLNNLPRSNIAHIRADKSVDPAFDPNANGAVNTLALSGTTLYVGGEFSSIGGQTRNRIAALNTANGAATAWNPNANGDVLAFALSGSLVYASGSFSLIGGQTRNRIAALDATTGQPTAWNPNANSEVNAIAVSGTLVYAGGSFSSIGGQSRSSIAALDATTGLATGWNPSANSDVLALAVSGTLVYAGGHFTTIGGQARNSIAALNASNGTATGWDPNADGPVRSLLVSGSIVYAGGYFTTVHALPRNYLAAIDVTTGIPTGWDPYADNGVHALALFGTTIYAGGTFTFISGQARSSIAAIDAATGKLTTWDPNAAGAVHVILVSGSTVYVGGEFTMIGTQPRNFIAALDATTGVATAWNPIATAQVDALALSGSLIYAGGDFTNIGGQNRNFIAALNVSNGTATSWNPNANGSLFALVVSGTTVYAGGAFTNIGGQARNYIAALNTGNNNATGWNPNANATVDTIVASGVVYAGGAFTTIGGQNRNRIAALDVVTGAASSWNPSATGEVTTIALSGSTVYAGGTFTSIGGQGRNRLGAVSASTGAATTWNPNADAIVYTVAVSGPSVYAGGDFDMVGGRPQQGFASFSDPPANTAAPVVSGTPVPGQTLTTTNGTWSGSTPFTFTYQWLQDGTPIGGETGSTYVVRTADQGHALSARVTAQNIGGSSSATSNALNVAPGNDAWANAVDVGTTGIFSGTNVASTGESGEPNHGDAAGPRNSVWYKLTPATSDRIATITTCGSGFDTVLAAYTGASVGGLTQVAANNDSCGAQSSITFPVSANTLYTVAVDGVGAATGSVTLNVTVVPANDNWANARDVSAAGSFSGTNVGSTGEGGEPNHGGVSSPLNSVWYKLNLAIDRLVTVTTCGSGFDTVLAAYTGASVGALTAVTSNNDSCGTQSSITFTAVHGVLYTIAVDGNGAATGSITLNVSLAAPPPPANDNWASAVDVGAGGGFSGTNAGSTGEGGEPNHGGVSSPLNSVWYKLNLAIDRLVTVTTCASGFDTVLAAYTGASVGALTAVTSNNDSCGTQSSITFTAIHGVLYTIAVDGNGTATGSITLNVSLAAPPPPANDNWASAVDVGAGGGFSGTNAGSTGEGGEPNHGGVSSPLNSVWYKLNLTTDQIVTMTTCGSSFDTVLAAYTGASVGGLSQVTSNNNSCGVQSSITFTAVHGVLYTVAVDGNGAATGSITLNVTLVPANDNWASATDVGAGGVFSGTNVGSTGEGGEPNHGGVSTPLNSVWYKLLPATALRVTITTCGSSFDTVLAAYTGASVGGLGLVAANNDACGAQSSITFDASAGTLYTIAVDGAGAATGSFTLNVTLVPANDNWVNAVDVSAGGTFSGTNAGSGGESGEPSHGDLVGPRNSVWYKLTLATDRVVTVATCGSSFDTVLAAYTGASVSGLGLVARSDNVCGSQSSITFTAVHGTPYTVAVDGALNATGALTLSVSLAAPPSPPNDDWANAADLGDGGSFQGTNVGSDGQSGEPNHGDAAGPRNSVWYRLNLTTDLVVTVATCDTSFDTVLAAYTGASVGGLTQVAANNNSCGAQSSITFTARQGVLYTIAVDGAGSATGPLVLSVSFAAPAPPSNDDWTDAVDVSGGGALTFFGPTMGITGSFNGTTVGATEETGEPDHADVSAPVHSAWYKLVLGSAGTATIDTCGSGFNTVLAAYTGSSVSNLAQVETSNDSCGAQSSITFPVTAGLLYTIAVSGFHGATGSFTLHVAFNAPAAPPNDDWVDARDIGTGFASHSATNALSTGEGGEPNHGGASSPLNSVWYKLTYPTTRNVQLDTCGSTLDTVLAVYTGSGVNALTEVASNNNGCGLQSSVTFAATGGITYTVAIDGAGSATGPFVLHRLAERILPNHPSSLRR